MSNNLQGKVIALTGGASGIGLETAKLLAARGAKVSIADITAPALTEAVNVIKSSGGIVMSTVLDVRDRSAVETWISETVEAYGKLDGAANLAGVLGKQLSDASFEDVTDEDWDFVLGVNLKGMLNCLRAQLRAGVMNDGGSIVNAASFAGIRGSPKAAAYVGSKHAVVGLTKVAALEQAGKNVRVNAIAPGLIDTPMVKKAVKEAQEGKWTTPMGRVGEASEVAELVAWLLCDASTYITGTVQSIDGGWAT